MDFDALIRRMGSEAIAQRMTRRFVDYYPTPLAGLQEALAQRDPTEVRRLAHSLKGSVSYFEIEPLLTDLKALQEAGEAEDWPAVERALTQVRSGLEEFGGELRAWLTPSP